MVGLSRKRSSGCSSPRVERQIEMLVPTIAEARVPPILELRVEKRASADHLSQLSSDSGY